MLVGLIIVCLAVLADAKVTANSVSVSKYDDWAYMDSFCFDQEGGVINLIADTVAPYDNTEILLYHDVYFPDIYNSGKSCSYKRSKASRILKAGGLALSAAQGGKTYTVTNSIPRWWYVVAANCRDTDFKLGQNQSDVQDNGHVVVTNYQFTWTNNPVDNKYVWQFSYDEQGIFQAQIFGIIAVSALLPVLFWSFRKHKTLGETRVHMFFGSMMFVCGIVWASLLCALIDRDAYSKDGYGFPGLKNFSFILDLFPDMLMCCLFLIVSKGWVISDEKMDPSDFRTTFGISIAYLACEIALLIWEFSPQDPALVLYRYEGAAGVCLCILRVLLMLYFLASLAQMRQLAAQAKRPFYTLFGAIGVVYFLVFPLSVIVAHNAWTYNKRKAVGISEVVMNVVCYWAIWALFFFKGAQLKSSGEARNKLRQDEGDYHDPNQFGTIGGADMEMGPMEPRGSDPEPNDTDADGYGEGFATSGFEDDIHHDV